MFPEDPFSFTSLRDEHLEWLKIRNYSEATVYNRERYLNLFIDWCAQRGLERPQEVSKPILERYQRHLFLMRQKDDKPLSTRSQHSRLSPLKSFFSWLTRQNYLLSNPASEIVLPRVEKRLPKVLSEREAETVLTQPNIKETIGLRDRAILETFYSTGIRRSSLVNLKVNDVDFDRGVLFIRQAKGKKDYMCPIGERARSWINKYLIESRPNLATFSDEGFLYLMNDGEKLSPSQLSRLCRLTIEKADIGKTGSTHIWRHTCVTLMLENGAELRFRYEPGTSVTRKPETSVTLFYKLGACPGQKNRWRRKRDLLRWR